MEVRKMKSKAPAIAYSCYHKISRDGEHFVPEHTLTYQIAGSLILNDGSREYVPSAGTCRLIKRNHLIKFSKHPPKSGDFKSLSIYLNQDALKSFSQEYDHAISKKVYGAPVVELKSNETLASYFHSMLVYHQNGSLNNTHLVELKVKEGLFVVLQANPELKNVLFDFSEPHKINLEAFMNRNYHFNVSIDRFAYLTGRSLASFKRDFQKIFGTSPSRWLVHRRLEEAYFQIKNKGKKPSEVYIHVGFENLSHFSYAFKNAYGVSPSHLE